MSQVSRENAIFEIIKNFTAQRSEQLLQNFRQISFADENQINSFNVELEKRVKITYSKMMSENNTNDLASLLESFFKSLKRAQIKISVVIWLMDNILECVGLTDLQKILKIFSDNIGQCGALEELDQNRLLKIINHLLKRVSKAQDYHIRGQLQLTLTMILPICHDSGFHRRGTIARPSQIQPQNQIYSQMGVEGGISYQFYQQFWNLQRYFMDPNEINSDKQKEGTHNHRIILFNLKKISATINETIDYFNKNPIRETESGEDHQPVKFLKILNLLPLQLNDLYFRNVILLQILIFCFSLKNPISAKNSLILIEEEKTIIEQIEKNTIITLNNSNKNKQLSQIYDSFLKNQTYWLDLKDNWKQHKKSFFKGPEIKDEQNASNEAQIKKKKQSQFIQLMQSVRKQIDQKMNIDGSKLRRFLENTHQEPLTTKPTIPSFTYYFNEGLQCLQSFDYETGTQNQFQSQTQYNIFEWKAMRSLYRENIKDTTNTDKAQTRIKDYRLLNFISQRQEETGEVRKKIKPNQ